jgi:hypothetical protein
MNIDQLIAAAKGAAWALVVLLLLHMCVGCKSKQHLVTEQATKRVSKMADTISTKLIAEDIRERAVDINNNLVIEKVHYSAPDTQGRQHVTMVERIRSASTAKVDEQRNQTIVGEHTSEQVLTDSVTHQRKTEEFTPAHKSGISIEDGLTLIVFGLLAVFFYVEYKRK